MSEFTLTPAQHTAIYEHRRNIAVSAGAGSGKTFILTNRFIALLEAFPGWRMNQIVAVTFTRKAAAEMRDRVRELLLARADVPGADPIWRERLNEMDSARISTIHSLCADILKANATEAAVDPEFAVLDEAETILLRYSAVEAALGSLADSTGAPATLFRYYTGEQIASTLVSMLASPYQPLPADLFSHWQSLWRDALMQAARRILASGDVRDLFDISLPDNGDMLADRIRMMQHSLTALRKAGDLAEIMRRLNEIHGTNVNAGSVKNWPNQDVLNNAKAVAKAVKAACKTAIDEIGDQPGDADKIAAHLLGAWHSVYAIASEQYSALKRAAGALDFEDLERLTRALLTDNAVAARYDGAEFQHVMLDEFQDTSAAQWDIARRIASPERPGSLFIVGDPKQSIYAFRGADPTVFETAQAQILASGGIAVTLDTSFRTHQPLVSCFNQAFGRIMTRDDSSPVARYQSKYDAMRAARDSMPDPRPPLHVLTLDDEPVEKPRDGSKAELLDEWEARALGDHIAEILASGRLIYDKKTRQTRPCQPGDIALLSPIRSNFPLYEEALRERDIPYVTLGGAGFYGRTEVWDLIHLLMALHNRADELALASALRSPLFAFSDDLLVALRMSPQTDAPAPLLWDVVQAGPPDWLHPDDQQVWTSAAGILAYLAGLNGRVSIADLLRASLDATGYLAVISALPDGARRRLNVEKLLEIAMKRRAAGVSVSAFTRYLNDMAAQEVRESEAALDVEGAVQIMTVHASKGLEFPIVLLADCGRVSGSGGPSRAQVWHDPVIGWVCSAKLMDPETRKELPLFAKTLSSALGQQRNLAEQKRLFYVAATRAQDVLVLSSHATAKDPAWFAQFTGALGLVPDSGAPSSEIVGTWGSTRWDQLTWDPQPPARARRGKDQSPFDSHDAAVTPVMPALLRAVPVDRGRQVRALRVTDIADLSRAVLADPADRPFHRLRWRRMVLHEAPPFVERVRAVPRISGEVVGEIVHQALQWHTDGQSAEALRERLECYAWEKGIVDAGTRERAVARAADLLDSVLHSDLYRRILGARQVYRELPFTFRTEKRTIHGVIDVLAQFADGQWAVIDYKTTWVQPPTPLTEHAHSYLLQVGVYAAAVSEQLDSQAIDVYIHYIRHRKSIQIQRDTWRDAVANIERYVGQLLDD
ncbi:MAG: UvrD-helicase domain-containing protein [Pleurocapsa minor GSE-CHR-MK-17-07R]|jgi:ATP-dependent helicase/nuclease subunit A|nr:UvrD-helicase domain-containing protein [Pleurocapsa minor GSE-CHR-MK 17-07R]